MPALCVRASGKSRRVQRLPRSLVAAAGAAIILAASGSAARANFLEDFEGEGEVSQIPAPSLRNWDIIESVDLKSEDNSAQLCHSSGACVDLVGTSGSVRGGITSKEIFETSNYIVGFFLYGSGRDDTGALVASGGTVSRVQVSLGNVSIFAHNNVPSDFQRFVVVHVRGSGKLQFLGTGQVPNIGPLVDNITILRAN
jgi:hypothetical protein